MRKLYFTAGSPFARAIRILLDEKGLEYEAHEAVSADEFDDSDAAAATLQVPAFVDGPIQLWDSPLIAEYLMAIYPAAAATRGDETPLAEVLWRAESLWADKLLLATILTLGASAAVVSQMRWTGVTPSENGHVGRNAARVVHLASWLEGRCLENGGFFPGQLSVQNIFLACFLAFIEKRPLGIHWRSAKTRRLGALCDGLEQRSSFKGNPILWWEPGVIGYAEGQPVFAADALVPHLTTQEHSEPASP